MVTKRKVCEDDDDCQDGDLDDSGLSPWAVLKVRDALLVVL